MYIYGSLNTLGTLIPYVIEFYLSLIKMVRLVLAWQFNNTLKVKLSYQDWSDSLSGDESSYIVCEILVTKSYTMFTLFLYFGYLKDLHEKFDSWTLFEYINFVYFNKIINFPIWFYFNLWGEIILMTLHRKISPHRLKLSRDLGPTTLLIGASNFPFIHLIISPRQDILLSCHKHDRRMPCTLSKELCIT